MSDNTPTEPIQGDIFDEILAGGGLSLGQAARMIPGGRGRPTAPTTCWRWASEGILINGELVKLEAVRIGGRFVTSKEAVKRFLQRQNVLSIAEQAPQMPHAQAARKRQRQLAEAKAKLREAGI